jgi:hypothetical protein
MNSEKSSLDYAGVILADLESKKSVLEGLIQSLKAALSMGALGQQGDGVTFPTGPTTSTIGEPIDLPAGAFLGKTITAAIALYLSAARKKQTIREIALALKEGGVESTSPNFENVVTSAINRMKGDGEVLRFKDGWGLAQWYPAGFRNLTQDTKGNGKKKAKRKVSARARPSAPPLRPRTVETAEPPKRKPGRPAKSPAPPLDESKGGPEARILAHFAASPGEGMSAKTVANALGIRVQTVGLICGKLVHQGKLGKTLTGSFYAGKIHQMPLAG